MTAPPVATAQPAGGSPSVTGAPPVSSDPVATVAAAMAPPAPAAGPVASDRARRSAGVRRQHHCRARPDECRCCHPPVASPAAVSPDVAGQPAPPVPTAPPPRGPMSLSGNPQQDMYDYVTNPTEYTKAVIASHSPVDLAQDDGAGRGSIRIARLATRFCSRTSPSRTTSRRSADDRGRRSATRPTRRVFSPSRRRLSPAVIRSSTRTATSPGHTAPRLARRRLKQVWRGPRRRQKPAVGLSTSLSRSSTRTGRAASSREPMHCTQAAGRRGR